jgi:DNA repair protein RecN (Recombination protein N)
LLSNIEKVANSVSHAYALLKQGERTISVVSALGEIRRELESAIRFDATLRAKAEVVAECLYQLEDVADELRFYVDNIDSQPGRLQKLEERMDIIHNVKKKYGSSIDEILSYQQQAKQELEALQNTGQTVEQLIVRSQELKERLMQIATRLDHERRQAAADLDASVTIHLRELGMPNAVFRIDVSSTEQFLPTGRNEVVCLFSANRGESPKLLQKVASGGELSRIALAIKSVNTYRDAVGTVVFDEVDAGIGGKTAQMVAEKIAFVAQTKQVFCITHSPPIASMADVHFLAEKLVDSDRTVTLVRQLTSTERMLELARMVAGDNTSKIAVDNARQMIETSMKIKEKWTNRA